MLKSYLDFEQPIADLEQQVLDLKDSDLDDEVFFGPSSFLISSKDLEVFSFVDFLDIIKNLYSKITTEIKQ